MAILCTLKNIHLSFGTKQLFKGAELTVFEGNHIGLLGLNGIGKSSLFKILKEELVPDTSQPPFTFDKKKDDYSVFLIPQELPLEENDQVTISNYLFRFYPQIKKVKERLDALQEIIEQNPEQKYIDEQIKLFESFEHLGGWDLSQTYESYLKLFGLFGLERKVIDLSGGEQKKILLSLGLSSNAKLILWDEPTNHLDMETIQLFEEELKNCPQAFIIITHDRYLLGKTTDKIIHIQNGLINTFEGSYQDYLEFLAKEEEDRLTKLSRLKNSLRRETDWMRQGIKARGTRSKKRVENFHDISNKVKELKAQQKRQLELSIDHSHRKTKSLIQLKGVSFAYPDSENLFNDLTLTLSKGDKVGVLGANGVGKSTLMNILAGKLAPTGGAIKSAEDLNVQMFSQKRDELDLTKSPFEILGDGTDSVILPNGSTRHVAAYFEQFLFNRVEIHRPLSTFSGGERNRLQMAINLLKSGDLWIFDEPTNDLDLETLQILESTLSDYKGAVLLISHDRSFLANVTNKTWVIDENGVEVFDAGYEQVEGYLQTLALEKELKREQDLSLEATAPSAPIEPKGLDNKEKLRLKEVQNHIQEKESLVDKIDQMIQNLGKTQMNDPSTTDKIIQLGQKKEEEEALLLEFYEELEQLESKLST